MAGNVDTRRQRIVAEVVRRLKEMNAGQPVSDPYRITFGVVTHGPLEGIHDEERYACGVMDPEERTLPKINQYDANLRLVVEFSAWVDDGEQPGQVLNRILGDVQRKLREDPHLTEPDDGRPLVDRELAVDVEETGSALFVEGFADQKANGAAFWEVRYKRAIDDPREYVGTRSS